MQDGGSQEEQQEPSTAPLAPPILGPQSPKAPGEQFTPLGLNAAYPGTCITLFWSGVVAQRGPQRGAGTRAGDRVTPQRWPYPALTRDEDLASRLGNVSAPDASGGCGNASEMPWKQLGCLAATSSWPRVPKATMDPLRTGGLALPGDLGWGERGEKPPFCFSPAPPRQQAAAPGVH